MRKIKIIDCFLVLFFLILVNQVGMPLEDEFLNLKVRVFRIQPFQGGVKSYPTKEGGVRGEVSGGNVTAFFPDGIVLLETDLYQNDEDLIKFIKEKVKFSGLGEKVEIFSIGAWSLGIPKNLEAYLEELKRKEEKEVDSTVYVKSYEPYLLSISPLLVQRGEVILRVVFHNFERLLNQTIAVKLRRTLLVGFPSHVKGRREVAYWIVFSFED